MHLCAWALRDERRSWLHRYRAICAKAFLLLAGYQVQDSVGELARRFFRQIVTGALDHAVRARPIELGRG